MQPPQAVKTEQHGKVRRKSQPKRSHSHGRCFQVYAALLPTQVSSLPVSSTKHQHGVFDRPCTSQRMRQVRKKQASPSVATRSSHFRSIRRAWSQSRVVRARILAMRSFRTRPNASTAFPPRTAAAAACTRADPVARAVAITKWTCATWTFWRRMDRTRFRRSRCEPTNDIENGTAYIDTLREGYRSVRCLIPFDRRKLGEKTTSPEHTRSSMETMRVQHTTVDGAEEGQVCIGSRPWRGSILAVGTRSSSVRNTEGRIVASLSKRPIFVNQMGSSCVVWRTSNPHHQQASTRFHQSHAKTT